MPASKKRRIILAVIVIFLLLIARPAIHLVRTYIKDEKARTIARDGYRNDASRLNPTKVEAVIQPSANIDEAIQQIISLVKQANEQHKKISIAGASHSMGGHTLYKDAIVLDMKTLHYVRYNSTTNTIWTGAGTLWSEILPYLDSIGKSVLVMQSNNSFSVGGSVSVNCHGWQPGSPPIASTVKTFRLITAEGKLLTCSRTENPELFHLVLGGYGLFGVIVDVELQVTDNRLYRIKQHVIKSDDYIKEFNRLVMNDPAIGLAYGRININPDGFMEEAILSTYSTDTSRAVPPLGMNSYPGFRRLVFRGSANSDYGKNFRWRMEKMSSQLVNGKTTSRNQLLNEGVEVYQNTDTNYTDILHEYFIPADSVGSFIRSLRQTLPAYKTDLLNITVRKVKKDEDAFLAYARKDVFGFVMLFNQSKDSVAEKEMQRLTQQLVDIALAHKGTYYLPYRLHASREQFRRAYPVVYSFFILKRKYDAGEVFRNQFYEKYR